MECNKKRETEGETNLFVHLPPTHRHTLFLFLLETNCDPAHKPPTGREEQDSWSESHTDRSRSYVNPDSKENHNRSYFV